MDTTITAIFDAMQVAGATLIVWSGVFLPCLLGLLFVVLFVRAGFKR